MREELNKKLGAMILLLTSGRSIRRTSLNKLLFFADMSHFLNTGRTISGSDYLRLQYGPVPEEIDVTRKVLMLSKYLTEERRDIMGSYHYLYTVDEDAVDLSAVEAALGQDELDAVQAVKKRLSGKPATYLSEKMHAFEPWKSSATGEILNFVRARQDEDLIRWLQRIGMVQKTLINPATAMKFRSGQLGC